MKSSMNGMNTQTVITSCVILSCATFMPDAAPSLFAGTRMMYSTNAMSQLTTMMAIIGQWGAPGFWNLRCQYQANVMNKLLATSIQTVARIPNGLTVMMLASGDGVHEGAEISD